MYKYFFLLLAIVAVSGCNNQNNSRSTFEKFPSSKNLTGTAINFNRSFVAPTAIELIDSNLVVLDEWRDTLVHIFNTNSKKYLGGAGLKGENTNQMLSPAAIMRSDNQSFWVYDMTLGTFNQFDLNSITSTNSSNPFKVANLSDSLINCYTPILLKNNIFASLFFGGGGRLKFGNTKGDFIKISGEFPQNKEKGISDTIHSQAYQGTMCSNTSKSKIAIANRYADKIEIYKSTGDKITDIIGPEKFLPTYDIAKVFGHKVIQTSQKGKFGYIFIQATDKYIYALYSGKSRIEAPGKANFGQFIDVFDWDGNPIIRYKLDGLIFKFALDGDKGFYAVNRIPTPQIVRYNF